VGELPFKWDTDFEYEQFGGWVANRDGREYERNILMVIPGRNRSQAVVMGDHYDTAYMEDVYETSRGGSGARISAQGADDNASATATLLLAAPIYLRLAKEGKLERDVWLIHLTGEEFPSDCMGARAFCQSLIERTLKVRVGEDWVDLSKVELSGVLVMDMIAHNRDSARDIFQISPGRSAASLRLAYQAHIATMIWNAGAARWNCQAPRAGRARGVRSADARAMPDVALHPLLDGQVRTTDNPQSSLFNTDVQIFSDIGAPCVLIMENYDIDRSGYHDTKDTLANIDLDYGSAVSAICIETIARMAVGT
ncbi:MAG TPA: M28 family peptidase, partial [Pseudomonadales bacterium]|nr:M28 family peptidase [Pseudomonadales bacterium]